MYSHFTGKLAHISPTQAVIDCNGVGYELNISLYTYEQIKDDTQVKLYAHLAVKEDAHTLYGFYAEQERELFRHLISVNGIGSATARMILSSVAPDELIHAISGGNISLLKSVKGVGPKSAQRIVLELQDKIRKVEIASGVSGVSGSRQKDEAATALQMLGFSKPLVEKAVQKIMEEYKGQVLPVEEIIKIALKRL